MQEKLVMLVVDDVEVNRVSLRTMFEQEYEILEAWNGEMALEILREKKVDVVILDIFMPVLDGVGVLNRMKADSALWEIPVIVKTSIDENMEAEMLECGADDFIFSPCEPSIVKKRVKNIVQKYILGRAAMCKKIEEEQHLSSVRGNFISGIAQELRGPVKEILQIADHSHSFAGDPERVREAFLKIKEQVEELQALANDIADMSTIDRAKMEIHMEVFRLYEVVSAISEEFYAKCREKGITFNFEVQNVIQETLIGDLVRVRQIWSNLLTNAYRFTEAGGRIRTSFSEKLRDSKHIELEIMVESTKTGTEPEENASGLRLSTTRGIVELMGGTFAMEARGEGGNVFWVRLPFAIEKKAPVRRKSFHSMETIILDDDEIAGDYLAAILTRLGIRCKVVNQVGQAMSLLKNSYKMGNGYEICFVNWYMKEGAGPLAVQQIREAYDKNTLLLVSSVSEETVSEDELKAAGINYVLKKPVLQSDIYRLMTDICKEASKWLESQKTDYDFAGKRVLVVEDNTINAELLMEFAGEANLQCDWVKNGQRAVEQYQNAGKTYYHAILMDINMAVMDGYQATREIRRLEKDEKEKIPIIAVTEKDYSEDVIKAYEAGMNAFIPKPIDPETLYRTMNKYLR